MGCWVASRPPCCGLLQGDNLLPIRNRTSPYSGNLSACWSYLLCAGGRSSKGSGLALLSALSYSTMSCDRSNTLISGSQVPKPSIAPCLRTEVDNEPTEYQGASRCRASASRGLACGNALVRLGYRWYRYCFQTRSNAGGGYSEPLPASHWLAAPGGSGPNFDSDHRQVD